MGTTLPEASSNSDIDCPGVVELVRAIDGLQHLYALHVDMRVCVGHSSFQRLRERMNKLPNMRARCCAAELRRNFFNTDTWLRACEQRLLRGAHGDGDESSSGDDTTSGDDELYVADE
jgi:hypothetical protein